MAPEVIKHEPYSASADVYSFAMVMYELITHHAPFADRSALQAAAAAGLEDKRPSLPTGTPPPLERLIIRAWGSSRTKRPPASELLRELEAMPKQLSPSEVDWLDHPRGHPAAGIHGQTGGDGVMVEPHTQAPYSGGIFEPSPSSFKHKDGGEHHPDETNFDAGASPFQLDLPAVLCARLREAALKCAHA